MHGKKRQTAGDLAEELFKMRWLELNLAVPAKPTPDREGIDFETFVQLDESNAERARVLFQVKSRVLSGRLPEDIRLSIKSENIKYWKGTQDPIYLVVVIGDRTLFRSDRIHEMFLKGRIFIANAQALVRNIDADERTEFSLRFPLRCELSPLSHALLVGSVLARARAIQFSTGLVKPAGDLILTPLLHFLGGSNETDLSYSAIRPALNEADKTFRAQVAQMIAPADGWVRALQLLSEGCEKKDYFYVVGTEPLGNNLIGVLFLTPTVECIMRGAKWSIGRKAMRRTLLVPDELKGLSTIRKWLLFVYLMQNMALGVEVALIHKSHALDRFERHVIPGGYYVESSYPDKDGVWHTEVGNERTKARDSLSLLEEYWRDADHRSKDAYFTVQESLEILDLQSVGVQIFDEHGAFAFYGWRNCLVADPSNRLLAWPSVLNTA